jgi:hypothetical protein
MARFVLRYRGTGPAPANDVEHISSRFSVVEQSPRMLLVDADERSIDAFMSELRGWLVIRESSVALPDPRRRPSGVR